MKYIVIIIVLIAAGALWMAYDSQNDENASPSTEGTQVMSENASSDDISVSEPQPNATVARTFTLTGQARGNWYFEASFPVQVVSNGGTVLFEGPVQAQGEWMTTEFVPFSTQITTPGSYAGEAWLVLRNDNASGLPENDKSVSIPIVITN